MAVEVKRKTTKKLLFLFAAVVMVLVMAAVALFCYRYQNQIKRRFGLVNQAEIVFSVFQEEQAVGHLSDYRVSQEEFDKLIQDRHQAVWPLLTDLGFSGGGLFQDFGSGWWYYSLKEGTEEAYDPLVSFKTWGFKGNLAVLGEISPEQIRSGEHIRLLVYTKTSYSCYELVCTTLPLMTISLAELDPAEYVPIYLGLYDNRTDAKWRTLETRAKMHVRGRTTTAFPKKGYRITLLDGENNRKENLLGLRKDDDWILYAGFNDQDRLRNVFSSGLWKYTCAENNQFDIVNGMEYRYVELFIDQRYYGLYALGYPIDEKQLGLGDGSYDDRDEFVYQKQDWDREDAIDFSASGPVAGYELKESTGETGDAAWEPLRAYYRVMFSEDTEKLKTMVDLPNAVDTLLFLTFIQGRDNISGGKIKNLYLTAKSTPEGYVMLYTPWDMDYTWGNTHSLNDIRTENYGLPVEVNIPWDYSPVQILLDAGDEDVARLVRERYAQLRSGPWSEETLMAVLDRFEERIFDSGAYLRDMACWTWANCLEDSSQGLAVFKDYVLQRLLYMDEYVAELTA